MKTNGYIITMKDEQFGEKPVWFAKFEDGTIGITPKRQNAFVCSEAEADEYVAKAQTLANNMMTAAYLPIKYARKAEKEPVIVLENELGMKEII